MNGIVKSLVAEMDRMSIIDAHEHMLSEEDILDLPGDVFTRIFCHYTVTDAQSAGMKADRAKLLDVSIPLDERWAMFRPWLHAIQDNGYVRAARIAARDLYDVDDINDDTYQILSDRIAAASRPGLYEDVLKGRCKFERILNQRHGSELLPEEPQGVHEQSGYFRMVYRGLMLQGMLAEPLRQFVERWESLSGCQFDDPAELAAFTVARLGVTGYAGIKLAAGVNDLIDRATAATFLRKLRSHELSDADAGRLGTWLVDEAVELAPRHNLPVAIHCGLSCACWAAVAPRNPMRLEPFLLRHRDTVFDLYHAGIPWTREIAVLANQLPHVHLNLCWCHQISPYITENMLNEWIDLVPANKIIAFGGDNAYGPEKTFGVLKIAKLNIARPLALRIERGEMTETRAIDTCRMWFYDNPKRIYRL